MSWRALVVALLILIAGRSEALDLKQQSVSSSKQFIVYCSDVALRSRVTGFTEDVKSDVLALLNEGDHWKMPIVITLQTAEMAPVGAPPVRLQMFATPDGPKIEINVVIGDDPAVINLQKQIARAVLLEIAYRDRGGVRDGEPYVEAPWWLVEGAIQTFRERDQGVDAELFQRMIDTNKIPSLEDFLNLHREDLGATGQAIDAACAMCLVRLLIDQSEGRENLGRLVRHWPQMHDNPIAALVKDYPKLGEDDGGLQKWWTANLAKFAAEDRYKGLSATDTDKAVSIALQIEIAVDKKGTKKTFQVGDYEQYLKLAGAAGALNGAKTALTALSVKSHALFRPVIGQYQEVLTALARGRPRGIKEKIAEIERYRKTVLSRIEEIADYLNWFEATQLGERSDAFDGYLREARKATEEGKRSPNDPIKKYLDELEKEFDD